MAVRSGINELQIKKAREFYKKLWIILSKKEKNKFKVVLILLVFSSFFEVLSLGSLLPFVAAIVSPETIHTNEYIKPIADSFGWNTIEKIQINFTISYICIVLLAAIFRIWLNIFEVKLIYSIGRVISCDIYKAYLLRSYSEYILSNSSEILSDLTHKVGELISSWLIPTVNLLVAAVLLIVTITTLIWINPYLMLSTFGSFGVIYLITVRHFKESVHKHTEIVATSAEKIIKEIQEASGNIRDIMLHGRQEKYSDRYNFLESNLRNSQAQVQILSFMPKTIIETLGIVFIAVLAFLFSTSEDGSDGLVVNLVLIVVGVQKILPLLNQIYNSYVNLRVGIKVGGKLLTRNDITTITKIENQSFDSVAFKSHIYLKNVFFSYHLHDEIILNNINLKIKKNSCIGVVGSSGSGKSTLSDILLGMLTPSKGGMYVDDVKIDLENSKMWRKKVAHVPQTVYLLDDTVLRNIVINSDIEEVNHEKLENALRLSSLQGFISNQKEGILSSVGERGVRLSGGQRQRIGIARAIYEGAEFLVFDEPTSALDSETEKSIISAISKLVGSVTIVIISHNMDNLKMCNKIIKIHNGTIENLNK